jgi:hypothetical protein
MGNGETEDAAADDNHADFCMPRVQEGVPRAGNEV